MIDLDRLTGVHVSKGGCVPIILLNVVKGLRIEGYSVPCVLDIRDGIPLKEI